MLETRFEASALRMLMKTGEESGMAFRVTPDRGPSPTLGFLRLMIGDDGCWTTNCCGGVGMEGVGTGGLSNVSVEGRGVLWAAEVA